MNKINRESQKRGFLFFCLVIIMFGFSSLAAAEEAGKNIVSIQVKGNKSISTNTILSKMKTRQGGIYQENVINEDIKRLYALGFFEDIKIDKEETEEGIRLIIEVTERPLIDKIIFKGIRKLPLKEDTLKKELKSREGQYLDYPTVIEDAQTLRKMYEKRGYNQTKVDYKVQVNPADNKAKVEFEVKESSRVRIKDIRTEGNTAISAARIRKVMKTKRAWLFNPGVLKEDVLKEDIVRIKEYYQRQGYADVEVDYEINALPRRPNLLVIVIKVKEGRRYLVGSVSIDGNKDITKEEILAKVTNCIPGKVFSREGMKKDIAAIQELYMDRGYLMVNVEESTFLSPNTMRTDITYRITENDIVYVDKIKIRGNVKTKDKVIRRELRIYPGDRFDGSKLKRSKERLQNLGFFEEISYDIEDTEVATKKNLIVDVKEAKTGMLSFGGGYSTVDEFVGFVEIEQRNFDWRNWPYFTGAGQDLKFRASFGSLSNNLELSFTEPYLFDYPLSFGFDGYRRQHERESDVGYGYDEKITGGDLRLGYELSEYLRHDLTYRFDSIQISDITADASSDLKAEAGKNNISSLTYAISYDSRDNIFDTYSGIYWTSSWENAGGILGGDKDFWKFYTRFSKYFGLWKKSSLELRLRLGLADSYGNSEKLPIYERFFAGGSGTVRGYGERKLGPVDPLSHDPLGGEAMLVGNIEYTYPVFDFLKAAVFYDIGNVWQKISDIGSSKDAFGVPNSGGFKSGFGVGMRLKTPIGPINLDYGIPLNKEPGETRKKSGKFYFNVSHGF